MEEGVAASALSSEPHPKTALACAGFDLNNNRLIRLLYQDRDGNIRQANSDNGNWNSSTPAVIVPSAGVATATPLTAAGLTNEVQRHLDHALWYAG